MINLSRNHPVALVFGAAGFIGSHLVEGLLLNHVQVVGVDNFSTGSKDNLLSSSKDKNFHLLIQDCSEEMYINLPRLDYAYFLIDNQIEKEIFLKCLKNFLNICKKIKSSNPKIVLISSIDLYAKSNLEKQANLIEAEKLLAKFCLEAKLNARVIRLSSVYGPRMHFKDDDPLIKLIHSKLTNNLDESSFSLDFSTRAIFISDAVALLLKAVFHGATSQKIYDGGLFYPLKIAEVKKLIVTNNWENNNFDLTSVSSFFTPNLQKSQTELNWQPKTPITESLKQTLTYFSTHPIPNKEDKVLPEVEELKKSEAELIIEDEQNTFKNDKKIIIPSNNSKLKNILNEESLNKFKNYSLSFILLIVFSFALLLPLTNLVLSFMNINSNLTYATESINRGDLKQGQEGISKVQDEVIYLEKINNIFQVLNLPILKKESLILDQSIYFTLELTQSLENLVSGSEGLYSAWQMVVGEEGSDLIQKLSLAEGDLAQSSKQFDRLKVKSTDPNFITFLPSVFLSKGLDQLSNYQDQADELHLTSTFLSQLVFKKGERSYLVILQDQPKVNYQQSRVLSFATVKFKDGKLIETRVDSSSSLKEKSLLDQNINFNDFVSFSSFLKSIYQNSTGEKIDGVVAVDHSAFLEILKIVGPVDMPSSNIKITEQNFNQYLKTADDKSITQLFKSVLEKVLFMPQKNYYSLIEVFTKQVEQEHMLVYFSDPILVSLTKGEIN